MPDTREDVERGGEEMHYEGEGRRWVCEREGCIFLFLCPNTKEGVEEGRGGRGGETDV